MIHKTTTMQSLTIFVALLVTHAAAFTAGALVFRNNRKRLDRAEKKAEEALDALRK